MNEIVRRVRCRTEEGRWRDDAMKLQAEKEKQHNTVKQATRVPVQTIRGGEVGPDEGFDAYGGAS